MQATTCFHDSVPNPILQEADVVFHGPIPGSVPNLLKLLSEFAIFTPPEIGALNGVFVVLCL